MEILLFVLGGLASWVITHAYYRRSSQQAPEWAKPLIERLPDKVPTESQLVSLVQQYLHEHPLTENGTNANGEYLRYTNGIQVCKGQFAIEPAAQQKEAQLVFPARFFGEPSVEISGEIAQIASKRATDSALVVAVKPSTKRLQFGYQATGRWTAPEQLVCK